MHSNIITTLTLRISSIHSAAIYVIDNRVYVYCMPFFFFFFFFFLRHFLIDHLLIYYPQRITVQWPNRKLHDSVHPNITCEREIRDKSSEILTGKKATEYPIIMRFSTAGPEMNVFQQTQTPIVVRFSCRPYRVQLNQ